MMSRRWIPVFAAMLGVGFASTSRAAAQATPPRQTQPRKDSSRQAEVPRNLRPPPGMCRVWVDRVPAGQQPAPTDCANAIRNRPPNGRVIFSDEQSRGAKGKPPARREPPKPARKPPAARPDTTGR